MNNKSIKIFAITAFKTGGAKLPVTTIILLFGVTFWRIKLLDFYPL